jgi:hypothetical protein
MPPFGPSFSAVVCGERTHLWIYLVAPVVGALLAVAVAGCRCRCRCTQDEGCCSKHIHALRPGS